MTDSTNDPTPEEQARHFTRQLFGKTTEPLPETSEDRELRSLARNLFGKGSSDPAEWAGALRGTTEADIDTHAAKLAKHRPFKDETGSFLKQLFGDRRN